jgi:D-alanine-D-alanine ligase
LKVLVLGGGVSSEREISLASSNEIFLAAKKAGYIAEYYDWDGSSVWLKNNANRFDVVLPILHGIGGEDGRIQQLLEELRVPYLGTNSAASELCFNKGATLDLLKQNNIAVPSGRLVDLAQYKADRLFTVPHVLKPIDSGSSVDTFIFPSIAERTMKNIEEAFTRHPKMLLEEFVQGHEITVPILEGKKLPVTEVIPPVGEVFDLENKYNGKTLELIPPKNISQDTQARAVVLAQKVHDLMGCRHLSRVDMIVRGSELYVLEVNTMPGMTNESLFPQAVEYSGMSLPELVDYFIKLVARKA